MKDINAMSGPELAIEYNRLSGKPPIKRFSSVSEGRRRVAALSKAKPQVEIEPGLVGEFGVRKTSNRAKLLRKLEGGKPVRREDLIKVLYGNMDKKHIGAFAMVMKGLRVTIANKKLSYDVRQVKHAETKEVTYAITAKR